MRDAIKHRGPDDSNAWWDLGVGVALGHQRLSIVDLSVAGRQPMESPGKKYIIIFNGEIYNHNVLREELNHLRKDKTWVGASDTETLLIGFDIWGIEVTLQKSVGMFALAVWDIENRCLLLARDRTGEKPLYYGWQGDDKSCAFLFASEIGAIKAHSSFENNIDRSSVHAYLRYNYVPAPASIYKNIFKLPPGSILKLTYADLESRSLPEPTRYWSVVDSAIAGFRNPWVGSEIDAIRTLHDLVKASVGLQMVADVPIGAFLSGGIDSSLIVALMQIQSTRSIKTFTIGFDDQEYNEAIHARGVANHLGTDHTEYLVSENDALMLVDAIPVTYDEPFADSSQLPTILLSKIARRQVTVCLSGDGADEFFCGYRSYRWLYEINKIQGVKRDVATALLRLMRIFQRGVFASDRLFSDSNKLRKIVKGTRRLESIMRCQSYQEIFEEISTNWPKPEGLIIGGETAPEKDELLDAVSTLDIAQQMMLLDSTRYLPDDILVKVDRASMAVGLETRAPFLDHRIIEYAWRLPQNLKYQNKTGKWILRQILHKYVPKHIVERPKMGFSVPLDKWLRGPLRPQVEEYLNMSNIKYEGILDPNKVDSIVKNYYSGNTSWLGHVWAIFNLQKWMCNKK